MIRAEEGGVLFPPSWGKGLSTESALGEEEAGRWQPGSQELSELTASWPGPAVGASPGLSFLRGWAGGLTEPFVGRGCMRHQVLGSCLVPTQAHLPRSSGVAYVLRAMTSALQPV